MIMRALLLKSYVPFLSCLGLLASTDLPNGYLQLGVAGASLSVLVVHMRMTGNQNREFMQQNRDLVQSHKETVVDITGKFDSLIRDVLKITKDGVK